MTASRTGQNQGTARDASGRQAQRRSLSSDLAHPPRSEGIESTGRFVEEQHLGSCGKRCDQRDLLAVALRVGAGLLGRVEPKLLDEGIPIGEVDAAVEVGEELEALAPRQPGPEVDVAGHEGEAPVGCLHVTDADTHDRCPARGRPDEAEQETERRRLACAVRSERPEHLAHGHVESQSINCREVPEPLGQPVDVDRWRLHASPPGVEVGSR